MSNIDKRALRKSAMHAKTTDDWGCDADNFHDKATPDAVLALLDDLEAAEKRIAELEERTLVPVEPTLDQLVAGKRRLTSTGRMSRLMSQRLAEVYRAMVNAAATGKGEA
ncbi:ead/Ea22-like family protein [Enterobacter roggenkampii]|uniref:ead/Ea22-like family protein n=1 Tax=Enterobacter roggenkampii TaxID=1812935 RepID=UPI00354FEFDE